jgi:hypothetical protein
MVAMLQLCFFVVNNILNCAVFYFEARAAPIKHCIHAFVSVRFASRCALQLTNLFLTRRIGARISTHQGLNKCLADHRYHNHGNSNENGYDYGNGIGNSYGNSNGNELL